MKIAVACLTADVAGCRLLRRAASSASRRRPRPRQRRRRGGGAAASGSARGVRLQPDLRRQEPDGLGLRSRFLAGGRRGDRRRDRGRAISRSRISSASGATASPGDFELKLQYKLSGADTGNSGIQYRSVELPEVGRVGAEGLPGGHRRAAALHGTDLRGAGPRISGVARADQLHRRRQEGLALRLARRRRRVEEADQGGRLERHPHHLPRVIPSSSSSTAM